MQEALISQIINEDSVSEVDHQRLITDASIKQTAKLTKLVNGAESVLDRTYEDTRPETEYNHVEALLLTRRHKYFLRYEEMYGKAFNFKRFPPRNDPKWADLKEETYRIVQSMPPRVEIPINARHSPILTGQHLLIISGAIPADTEIIYHELDYEHGPSIGIEIEQTLKSPNLNWIKKIDQLWSAGIPVDGDADREISPPPTQDIKLLKEVYVKLVQNGYILDENPNLHVTLGGLEGASLVDLLYLNILLSCTGNNSFRTSNPRIRHPSDLISVANASSKNLYEEEVLVDIADYPIHIKNDGNAEFRSLFWPETNTAVILKGLDTIQKVSTTIWEDGKGTSDRWSRLVEQSADIIGKSLGVTGQDLINHVVGYAHLVRASIFEANNEKGKEEAKESVQAHFSTDKLVMGSTPEEAYAGIAFSTLCGVLGTLSFDNQMELGNKIQDLIDSI